MNYQKTSFESLIQNIFYFISRSLIGPWKKRSIGLISLLVGYFLGSNLTVYYLEKTGQRVIISLCIVLIIELIVRLRSIIIDNTKGIQIIIIDNLRLGFLYSIVIEAFKLGS